MLKASFHYKVNTFAHHWIENRGNGVFKIHKLPNWAQLSSINAVAEIGKWYCFYSCRQFIGSQQTPRNDASIGLVLESDAKGEMRVITPSESGLVVKGEVKAIRKIKLASGKDGFLFAVNNVSLKLVEFDLNP
jgi:hypothetical protein